MPPKWKREDTLTNPIHCSLFIVQCSLFIVHCSFVMAVSHIASFYTESPEVRYVKMIKQHNDFLQRIPQYHIASFLGIKPQSLCRIKKRLLKSNS
jgi:hypothetical protein